MSVLFRNYVMDTRYGDDYDRLREFYLNGGGGDFSFGRWDWMISHAYLDVQGLTRIGIWEEEGRIVGVVSYDTVLDGCCFFSLKDGYDNLCEEMIDYAQMHLTGPDGVMLAVRDDDCRFQDAALKMGYLPTQYKDCTAAPDSALNTPMSAPRSNFITISASNPSLLRPSGQKSEGFAPADPRA